MNATGNWSIVTPELVDLDGGKLDAAIVWLDGFPQSNIHSILVARQGALAFEHYRRGDDQRWNSAIPNVEHGPEVIHDLRSATKSVVALLVGIGLARGFIKSLDEPVFSFFPEYADLETTEKDGIALRHLLTMTSGLEWDENVPISDPRHGEMRMWRSPDHLRTALEPPMIERPGSAWNYSGGCTELLGAVLRKTSGNSLEAFAKEALFEPLGIDGVEWLKHSDANASASGGLRMSPRNLAKIGQLVVARGSWQDRQIVPAEWIDESIAPHVGAADRLFFYGYQWWLGRSLVNRHEVAWASAIGLGGQRLFVIPAFDLTVVITAGHYADAMQAWLPLVILNRYVLPAVKNLG